MVAASYGLTPFTQTRYDLHDQKVKHVRTHLAFNQFIFEMAYIILDVKRARVEFG